MKHRRLKLSERVDRRAKRYLRYRKHALVLIAWINAELDSGRVAR